MTRTFLNLLTRYPLKEAQQDPIKQPIAQSEVPCRAQPEVPCRAQPRDGPVDEDVSQPDVQPNNTRDEEGFPHMFGRKQASHQAAPAPLETLSEHNAFC